MPSSQWEERVEVYCTRDAVIPIHPEVKKMLPSLPRSFQFNRVFLRRVNGQYIPFDNFRKSWESARKMAGLDDFVFHDFRHVAISNLRKAGNSHTEDDQDALLKKGPFEE